MTKKKLIVLSALALAAVTCIVALLPKTAVQEAPETLPAATQDSSGIHTWEDYLSLSPEEKEAFFQTFDSEEAFNAWVSSARTEETIPFSLTWDKPGKAPNEYTWDEYLALTYEDQERFYQWFDSREAFEQWMTSAKPEDAEPVVVPWNKSGKAPNEYTWEEYQALSVAEKESFYHWFDSADAFNTWANAARPVQNTDVVMQWDKAGKAPDEYTWDEYQSLSGEDQEKFYRWFDSDAAFEAWMNSVKPQETTATTKEWSKSGKDPSEYTWEEYLSLSSEDQDSFSLWFGSEWDFEQWMTAARTDAEKAAHAWDKSGKNPDAYTWEEYEALSPEDQEKFYYWFSSVEAFETWMNAALAEVTPTTPETWNKTGKTPDNYTWEEYEALSPQEQDLFFQWFGSVEAFEAWMDSSK